MQNYLTFARDVTTLGRLEFYNILIELSIDVDTVAIRDFSR